ncbi:RNA-binding domain-containing protein [Deinococcus yunweiensis]|uniref:RNA-binding domain-containing protein n=1 Tax=Deinococcus yunweiensis TaxID=367282 RepID=UPI00398E5445
MEDIKNLREGYDFEAKEAAGQDGTGEVPRSVWQTYSAMANTSGGNIVLGLKELKDGSFQGRGIKNIRKVLADFWNTINDKKKVSICLLNDSHISLVPFYDDHHIIVISVPRANRRSRPVYLNGDPLQNTYRRNHEGDYHCTEQEVRRMIADSVNDTRDDAILSNFTMQDFDIDSIAAYRNEFRSASPGHPWINDDDQTILQNLGGWRKDRESGEEGPTLAGILMFGRWRSILDAVSLYNVDYRDTTGNNPRWSDRLTPDGKWSGNLYDFYRRVYIKLVDGLKMPFNITDGRQRRDITPVHEALREALVNSLVHCDYSISGGIVIVKREDGFDFTNPGGLRLPRDQVMRGGRSDCRNLQLQVMFQFVGAGDKAGSGIPKILHAWNDQHWTRPTINETVQPESVTLTMSMVSMFPERTMASLREKLGNKLDSVDNTDRIILAIAEYEGEVYNRRLQATLDSEHPRALTDRLNRLVDQGMLLRIWKSSWTTYQVRDSRVSLEPFPRPRGMGSRGRGRPKTPRGAPEGQGLFANSQDASGASQKAPMPLAGEEGGLHPALPTSNSKLPISSFQVPNLEAKPESSQKTQSSRERVEAQVLEAATEFRTLGELAEMLGRQVEGLRVTYVNSMIADGRLELRYPDKLRHPKQAYRARRP